MSATITRHVDIDTEPVTVWAGADIHDEATQQAAVAAFLDPDNCPQGTYLVANARLQQYGEGWITVAMMEWRESERTVVIQDLGKPEIAIAADDENVGSVIATRLSELLGGTANILPGSAYRQGQ